MALLIMLSPLFEIPSERENDSFPLLISRMGLDCSTCTWGTGIGILEMVIEVPTAAISANDFFFSAERAVIVRFIFKTFPVRVSLCSLFSEACWMCGIQIVFLFIQWYAGVVMFTKVQCVRVSSKEDVLLLAIICSPIFVVSF